MIKPKKLLVEGASERRVIPELMEKNGVDWPKDPLPVWIDSHGGYENLVKPGGISGELVASDLTHLGIIVDADDNELLDENNKPIKRWQSLRNACLSAIPGLPEFLPETGLIHLAPNNIKFGIWIMPDNRNKGMLETFLSYLVPDQSDRLWQFTRQTVQEAKENYQADFKEVHRDKANIYTWLAWQDEPGRQLHEAIKETIFHANHPKAQDFVNWFKNLYDL